MPSPQAGHDPVATLLSNTDPIARSRAHTTLAHRAIDNDDLDTAEVHLREATDLDPTDEGAPRVDAAPSAPHQGLLLVPGPVVATT